jgi:two-component system, OmpR family, manganese sensing response regulator
MAKILLVDDSEDIVGSVSRVLKSEQYEVEDARTAADCLQMLEISDYDLLVLDWQLPDKSGVEILQAYRKRGGTARVLMLTGRRDVTDKEQGFDAGADDYLTKPFDPRELTARVKALLRRPLSLNAQLLTCGNLSLDLNTLEVRLGDQPVELNRQELKLLEFFMRNPNRVFNEEAIITRVWEDYEEASSDALRSALKRLRKKIDPDGDRIKNIRGLGYMFRTKE